MSAKKSSNMKDLQRQLGAARKKKTGKNPAAKPRRPSSSPDPELRKKKKATARQKRDTGSVKRKHDTGSHKKKRPSGKTIHETAIMTDVEEAYSNPSKTPLIVIGAVVGILLVVVIVLAAAGKLNPFEKKLNKKVEKRQQAMLDFKRQQEEQERNAREEMEKREEAKRRETWDKAVLFADQAILKKDDYERAVSYFNLIKAHSDYKGTKYVEKAEKQIKRIEQAKKKAADDALEALQEQVKPLIEKKQFKKAAETYQNYTGPFAVETEVRRFKYANECMQKQK